MVQVSEPKEIYSEYRFWIIDGRVVTQSLYKQGDVVRYSPIVDQYLINYVKTIDVSWLPKALVLDVANTPDGPRILEINTINSAGFYAGDIQRIVMALEDMES